MVSNFTVFGSCACRDIFNSTINHDYKKYFRIGRDGIRQSIISLMQKPVSYDFSSIEILPKNDENAKLTYWIKEDLDKSFLEYLKEDQFEYILMDTYYDVNYGILDLGGGEFITNNIGINQTEFFRQFDNIKELRIQHNPKKYFKLFSNNCDLFFQFIEENCPDSNVILNPNRHVATLIKKDGEIEEDDSLKNECLKFNKFRDILDEYILNNFDVDILNFSKDTKADENHLWGIYSLHYEPKYFSDANNQLNAIIKRNNAFNSQEFSVLNCKLRNLKRKKLILDIELGNLYDCG